MPSSGDLTKNERPIHAKPIPIFPRSFGILSDEGVGLMVGSVTPWMRRHGFDSAMLLLLLLMLAVDQTMPMRSIEEGAYGFSIRLHSHFFVSSNLHASYPESIPLRWGLYGAIFLFLTFWLPRPSRLVATVSALLLAGGMVSTHLLLLFFYGYWWPVAAPVLFLSFGFGLFLALPPRRPPPKTRIGPYQIEQTLGSGAMSQVYLARDIRTNQTVALKRLSQQPDKSDNQWEAAKKRFLHGATIAKRLNHPNIVCIHDQGEAAGVAYVAMEPLTGHSLERYTQHDAAHPPLPLSWVILIVGKIAMALDHAHKNQIVHRDVKPDNILFDPATGQIKLLDFCTAQAVGMAHPGEETEQKKKSRLVVGTPYYMSPEQLLGKPLDGRSDLFSLGVLLYQLLTGSLPFPAREMAELLTQITHALPVDPLTIRPTLPPCLGAIVNKALQKEVSKRYQTGREMTEALTLCVKNQIKK